MKKLGMKRIKKIVKSAAIHSRLMKYPEAHLLRATLSGMITWDCTEVDNTCSAYHSMIWSMVKGAAVARHAILRVDENIEYTLEVGTKGPNPDDMNASLIEPLYSKTEDNDWGKSPLLVALGSLLRSMDFICEDERIKLPPRE